MFVKNDEEYCVYMWQLDDVFNLHVLWCKQNVWKRMPRIVKRLRLSQVGKGIDEDFKYIIKHSYV